MAIYYPGASRAIWSPFQGSPITPNVAVLHSTEGGTVTDYQGGAVAPHLTVDLVNQRVWQHVPLDRSARALVNLKGGVETNTLNALQIEILGTCDPRSKVRPFLPGATEAQLGFLADVLRTLHNIFPALPLRSSVAWKGYPGSYGTNGVRLTGAAWQGYYGVLGHQHVPENVHGDPGAFNVPRVLQLAGGAPQSPAANVSTAVKTAAVKAAAQVTPDLAAAFRAVSAKPISSANLRPGRSSYQVYMLKVALRVWNGPGWRAWHLTRYGSGNWSQAYDAFAVAAVTDAYRWLAKTEPGKGWDQGDLTVPGPRLLRRIGFTNVTG